MDDRTERENNTASSSSKFNLGRKRQYFEKAHIDVSENRTRGISRQNKWELLKEEKKKKKSFVLDDIGTLEGKFSALFSGRARTCISLKIT